jgi:CRP-like cAMP-binding protein
VNRDQLKRVPLFSELSHRELDQVAQWADELDVELGRHVVDQGDFGYEFFAIIEGTADVLKDGELIRQMGPGDFFGELALIGEGRRTASVVSTTRMRLAVMLKRDFLRLEEDLPEVADKVRTAIEERK